MEVDMALVRVAAAQFEVGVNIEQNFEACYEMIRNASKQDVDLLVLPEFVNHASWYKDKEHCYQVSLALDSEYLRRVSDYAKLYSINIVINVTLQRPSGLCTGSSLLYDNSGSLLTIADKQVLMGHEAVFLQASKRESEVVETTAGRVGLYSCMDGVIPETPRSLALKGAQIMCNSLNSFAFDEADLHIPVRAAENKVFVVAANKIGCLIPETELEQASQLINIPKHYLLGAGESQIVGPDGDVLAKASKTGAELIYADIDPKLANRKISGSGSDIFLSRRSDIYKPLAKAKFSEPSKNSTDEVAIGVWQSDREGLDAVDDLMAQIPSLAKQCDVLVLPEIFYQKKLDSIDMTESLELSMLAVDRLTKACKNHPDFFLFGSFLGRNELGVYHSGMLLNHSGVVAEQLQVHKSSRYNNIDNLGGSFEPVITKFGKIGLVVGEDSLYPETFRLLALGGAELFLVSMHAMEPWEQELGLVERCAENRVALVAASRPSLMGGGFFAELQEDFTLLTNWKHRAFDGNINTPLVFKTARHRGVFTRKLRLSNSQNKVLSGSTHLLNSRPRALISALTDS